MENKRTKKILVNTRESEFILSLILVIVVSMLIGLCAYAQKTTAEFRALQQQIMSIQNDVNKIEFEVAK